MCSTFRGSARIRARVFSILNEVSSIPVFLSDAHASAEWGLYIFRKVRVRKVRVQKVRVQKNARIQCASAGALHFVQLTPGPRPWVLGASIAQVTSRP